MGYPDYTAVPPAPGTVIRWTGSEWEEVKEEEDRMEEMYKEQRTINVMEVVNNIKGIEFESINDFLASVDDVSTAVVESGKS